MSKVTHPCSKTWEAAALLQLYGHLQVFLLVGSFCCQPSLTLCLLGQLNPVALHVIVVLPVQVLIQLQNTGMPDTAVARTCCNTCLEDQQAMPDSHHPQLNIQAE